MASSDGAGPAIHILLVDDDRSNRFVLKILLTRLGHHVVEAANGIEALALAKEQVPQLIITDLGMPVMNGYELAREIRSDQQLSSVTLIAITGESRDHVADQLQGCEFDHFITKPVDVKQIISLIEQINT